MPKYNEVSIATNEAGRLQNIAHELNNSRLQEVADRFTYLLAVATGKTSQV